MIRVIATLAIVFVLPLSALAGNDDNELLRVAARSGSAQFVRSLLLRGANKNAANVYGETPLMHAAMTGSDEAAEVLINAGAATDAVDVRGYTAIHWAVHSQYSTIKTLKVLLERNANLHIRSNHGKTPLMDAVERIGGPEQLDRIRILLRHGANPNDRSLEKYNEEWALRDKESWLGNSVLMFSAMTGQVEVVKILLKSGADLHQKREDDQATAEQLARNAGHTEIVRILNGWKQPNSDKSPN